MEVIALQSGSSGNCIYVEAGGKRLLFDAGISGIQAESRLADHGRNIRDIDALIISHDHRDHAVGMGIYQRKYGLPIYVTRTTLAVAQQKIRLGKMNDIRHFDAGSTFTVGGVKIRTIPTRRPPLPPLLAPVPPPPLQCCLDRKPWGTLEAARKSGG